MTTMRDSWIELLRLGEQNHKRLPIAEITLDNALTEGTITCTLSSTGENYD